MFNHKSIRYLKTLLFCLTLFLISNLLFATPPQQNYLAERIILDLTENPSTSQAVTWRTNLNVLEPQAQIALANEYTDLNKEAKTVHATTEIIFLSILNSFIE